MQVSGRPTDIRSGDEVLIRSIGTAFIDFFAFGASVAQAPPSIVEMSHPHATRIF